ncbi:hypothetical protein JHN61_28365 [Streptomyces sp. MBT67]|uniref:hypothetical protein n=1 Tax=unclassified Streptomyces TaxID=2593676 RepID=UPI001909C5E5|nr:MULTISPECIES: hypothetical protein [unclassified Streptomyces]MBK3529819.1 hypothetical protein [Streptomyces sp. MBT72]MBK3540055.1 hypothetical protein [Streptomyces sp. MBT67]MBK3554613.1 hypothetical protein [Streptomyces sp. MBT61]MBK6032795.1 hypothetical protein [Streptomyces sp. MBT59]
MTVADHAPDDAEYDDYDPAWQDQVTPFRRWLTEKLTNAGSASADDMASMYAPANRYRGLQESDLDLLAILTNTTIDAVLTAHRADLTEWAQEQQLRDHPDLAVLDADLDRIHRRT